MIQSIISKASLDLSPAAASKFLAWSSTVNLQYFVVDSPETLGSATLGVESKTAFLNPVTSGGGMDSESKFEVDNHALTTVAQGIEDDVRGTRYNDTVLRAAFDSAMRSDDVELKPSILAPVVVAYHLDVIATRVDTELRDAIKGLTIETKLDESVARLQTLSELMGRLQLMISTLKQVDGEFSLHDNASDLKPLDRAADEAFDGTSNTVNQRFLGDGNIKDMTQHEVYFEAVKSVISPHLPEFSQSMIYEEASFSEQFGGKPNTYKGRQPDSISNPSVPVRVQKVPIVVPLFSDRRSMIPFGQGGGIGNCEHIREIDNDASEIKHPTLLQKSFSTTASENSNHSDDESSHSEPHSDDDVSTTSLVKSFQSSDGAFTRSGSPLLIIPPPPPTHSSDGQNGSTHTKRRLNSSNPFINLSEEELQRLSDSQLSGVPTSAPTSVFGHFPIPPAVSSGNSSLLARNLGGSRVPALGNTLGLPEPPANRIPTQGPSLDPSQIGLTLLSSPLPTSDPSYKLNPYTTSRPSTVDSELEDGHSIDGDETTLRSRSNSDHSVRSVGVELEVDAVTIESMSEQDRSANSSRSPSPTSDSLSSDSGFNFLIPVLPTSKKQYAGDRRT